MNIETNVNLKQYNTLQIPVKAKYLVRIEKESDVFEFMKSDLWKNEKHCILNGWSNIFFTKDFDWIVIKVELMWKKILESENNCVLVEVMAGENWS